jgi:tyrosinase
LPKHKWPAGATWDECQHDGWYFLPWHRIYLYYFEAIVRSALVKFQGSPDWALPYWSYSDATKPKTRSLPPAFLAQRLPDGAPNPLFTERRKPQINGGAQLGAGSVALAAALAEEDFTGSEGVLSGFGGGVTNKSHGGGPRGSLENVPHGTVHGGVGGDRGLMSAFDTAGLDPIFWLHHANIDRLWDVWLGLGGPRSNPTERRWLDTSFTFGQGAAAVTLAVRDVIDSKKAPLSYAYSDVSVPVTESALQPQLPPARREGPRMRRHRIPEMIGGSDTAIPLTNGPTHAEIALSAPSGPARARPGIEAGELPKVYLKIENITGTRATDSAYAVHVNLPQGAASIDHPELEAGHIALFGIPEATALDDRHTGSGVTVSFDITNIARLQEQSGDWDPQHLRVTFTPLSPADQAGESDVRAGRVSVFVA